LHGSSAATAVGSDQYAFLAVLVALVVTVALGTVGSNLNSTFDRVTTQFAQGASSSGPRQLA
jgi:Flp pilus assembly pilin Flp